MLMFVTAVTVVLVVSFLCSIFESVLLSITRPQIELMVGAKKRAGRLLASFKENMDVAAAEETFQDILILKMISLMMRACIKKEGGRLAADKTRDQLKAEITEAAVILGKEAHAFDYRKFLPACLAEKVKQGLAGARGKQRIV